MFCVYANCINFGSGVYFYWNFNIPPSFPLINLFYTRYKKIVPLSAFWTKMSPLKPIKIILIAAAFNCKMMQFLLIGFHSVGKASKLFFLPDGAIILGLVYKGSIKQILTLFLFSASAYYRANWINNAAIIVCVCVLVWMSECGLYVCHKKKLCVCVCVLVKFEREKLYCKSQIKHCVHQWRFAGI